MNAPSPQTSLLSPLQLAEYLDVRDSAGAPDARTVVKLSREGSLPPPDTRRIGGEVFWYRKTIVEFVGRLSGTAEPEPLLIDGKALAKMIGVTVGWVKNHRYRIIGAQRIGGPRGPWRYNVEIIRGLILSGKDILEEPPVKIPFPRPARPVRKSWLKN